MPIDAKTREELHALQFGDNLLGDLKFVNVLTRNLDKVKSFLSQRITSAVEIYLLGHQNPMLLEQTLTAAPPNETDPEAFIKAIDHAISLNSELFERSRKYLNAKGLNDFMRFGASYKSNRLIIATLIENIDAVMTCVNQQHSLKEFHDLCADPFLQRLLNFLTDPFVNLEHDLKNALSGPIVKHYNAEQLAEQEAEQEEEEYLEKLNK